MSFVRDPAIITAAQDDGPTPSDDRALPPASPLTTLLRSRATWVFGLDVALVVLFAAVSRNHVFWSIANARSLLLGATEGLLLALGLTMMLGAGIFDISLGANLVLSSVAGAITIRKFEVSGEFRHIWLAIAIGFGVCVLTGLVFGLVNGLLIAVADVNSLIATLATLGIGTGVAYLLADGSDVASLPATLQTAIGLRRIGQFPVPAIAAVVATLVLWGVVRFTRFGMYTLAIGSSRSAAERAGLRVRSHLIKLAALGGMLAGVAGFIDLSRFGSTSLSGHQNDALAAVTAAVIGGTALQGGQISIAGTVWGAGLAVILQVGLVISGVPSFWQLIVIGTVLLLAVILDRVSSRRRAQRH